MTHVENYFHLVSELSQTINFATVENMVSMLKEVRERQGRLFILGVGGSAANASHAVNDFRKLCNIETYAPTDNVSELTARTNDDGWDQVFSSWLKTSRVNNKDAILVFSVGGGSIEKNVSVNLIKALDTAKQESATILGILGKDGGYTAQVADIAIIVPPIDSALITPLTEAYQGIIWHCLVSHPSLQINSTKW